MQKLIGIRNLLQMLRTVLHKRDWLYKGDKAKRTQEQGTIDEISLNEPKMQHKNWSMKEVMDLQNMYHSAQKE